MSIFRPLGEAQVKPEVEPLVTVFTIAGKHNSLDENNNPVLGDADFEPSPIGYAKKVELPKLTRYYVKRNRVGHLINPYDTFAKASISGSKRNENSYREVTKAAFDHYLTFLKTRERTWLSQAERALNG